MQHDQLAAIGASYDAVAASYAAEVADEISTRPLERAMLDALTQECLQTCGRIVDLGCGPGQITQYLATNRLDTFGLDLSPGMIREARRQNPALDFQIGSMTALALADAACAGLICLYSIVNLSPAERVLSFREMARVCGQVGTSSCRFTSLCQSILQDQQFALIRGSKIR